VASETSQGEISIDMSDEDVVVVVVVVVLKVRSLQETSRRSSGSEIHDKLVLKF
jgi:hypothetical protein